MRQEHRHHTDEQIRETLAFARDLVAELELPDVLAPQAFVQAVNLRAAKSIVELTPQALPVPAMAIPGQR